MGVEEETGRVLAAKFAVIFPHLDERQRRLVMGAEARALGHGGIRAVARAAGVREATVSLGVTELDSAPARWAGRACRAGRKRAAELDPGLGLRALALVEPDERGDPVSPLRWTTKSTRKLAAELTRQGHTVAADTVGDLLREQGFSLQGNAKTIEGMRHPDRDAQFRYISAQVTAHQASAAAPLPRCILIECSIIIAALLGSLWYAPDYLHLTVNPEKCLRWQIRIRWRLIAAVLVLGLPVTFNRKGMLVVLAAAAWLLFANLIRRDPPRARLRFTHIFWQPISLSSRVCSFRRGSIFSWERCSPPRRFTFQLLQARSVSLSGQLLPLRSVGSWSWTLPNCMT